MLKIRKFKEKDLPKLKEITVICFDGVSRDQNMERMFGKIAGTTWQERKVEYIEEDCRENPGGVFVAVVKGEVVGYITTRIDSRLRVGRIMNFAVLPEHRGQGIGSKLMERALKYLRKKKMEYARIETLEQNELCKQYYPRLGFQEVARQIYYMMKLD